MEFENESSHSLSIYWVDEEGEEVPRATPSRELWGASSQQPTAYQLTVTVRHTYHAAESPVVTVTVIRGLAVTVTVTR